MILVNYVVTKSAVVINGVKAVKHNAIIVIKPRKFVFYYCLQGSLSSNLVRLFIIVLSPTMQSFLSLKFKPPGCSSISESLDHNFKFGLFSSRVYYNFYCHLRRNIFIMQTKQLYYQISGLDSNIVQLKDSNLSPSIS